MKIKDILQRDPSTHPLVNQGQARITGHSNAKELDELRGELSTFVCEGQYAEGIQRILNSFLTDHSRTSQRAAARTVRLFPFHGCARHGSPGRCAGGATTQRPCAGR